MGIWCVKDIIQLSQRRQRFFLGDLIQHEVMVERAASETKMESSSTGSSSCSSSTSDSGP